MRTGILSLTLLATVFAWDVIISPSDTSKPHLAFVLIQGASIPASRYAPLAEALQQELN